MKFVFLATVLCTGAALADVVYLNDGTRLEGNVKRSGDGWLITTGPGQKTHLEADTIKRIEIGAEDANPMAADARLASLRRSADYSTDINDILVRYQRFIDQNAGLPSAAEARKDLATWRDRRDRALVKFGSKWVTDDERMTLQANEIAVVDEARQLIKQGRLKEAEPVVQSILTTNPQSAGALYLRGWLAYQREELVPARKAMESVNALVSNHVPTLNNLGVIAYRQKQQIAALNFYDQALLSAPTDQIVLNNVAEALHALGSKERDNAVTKRVQRRFTEADARLQAEMLKKGLHRWGSQWVDDRELDRLQQAEKDVRNQLDDLADRYNTIEVRIARIDDDIDANTRAMRQIEARSYTRDIDGRLVRAALPSTYYDLQDDNNHLQTERDRQSRKLEELRTQAKNLQKNLPVPQFTGLQVMIGVEGTPAPVIVAPATRPATGKSAAD